MDLIGDAVKDHRGFSLLGLVVVLSIAGILAGLAFLNFPRILAAFYLSSAVRQVATDLQLVRMKAIAQNRRFRVTFNNNSYTVERDDGNGGWDPHVLDSHGTVADGAQPIFLPQGVFIGSVTSGGDVIFEPRGHVGAGENTVVTLRHPALSTTRQVSVSLAGQVRID